MSKLSKVYAAKENGALAIFDGQHWKEMGNQRNGWEAITEAQYEAAKAGKEIKIVKDTGAAQTEVKEAQYKALIEQAKGFEKDGKLDEALKRYQQAKVLKTTTGLTNKINKLVSAIEKEAAKNPPKTGNLSDAKLKEFKNLAASADAAMADEDFVLAQEYLESALLIQPEDAATKAKLAEAVKALNK